jgi:polysaccharide biosynthesis transport protein
MLLLLALMAAYIANVLFVVRPGSSYSSSVGDSFDQLTQHRAHVLGLVVNGVETVTKPYKYRLHDAIK